MKALLSLNITMPQFFEVETSVTIGVNFFSKKVEIENVRILL